MKLFALIFISLVGSSLASFYLNDICSYDGIYECDLDITYNWEAPSGNAIVAPDINTDLMFSPPFPMYAYGQDMGPQIKFRATYVYLESFFNNGFQAIVGMYPAASTPDSIRSIETKGTAPNRRIIFTFENFVSLYNNLPVSAQIKYYESGSFEVHSKEFTWSNGIVALCGWQISDGQTGETSWNFPLYMNTAQRNLNQYAMGMYVGPPPTNDVCGNNVVEGNEQCDGGVCCTSSCTFASSSQVCRAADGECDVAESCSGSSSDCPVDSFASSSTLCDEDFGVCDVRLRRTCPGNSGVCSGFSVPVLSNSQVDWLGYTVISFQSFAADTGSVGGRLAVKGDVAITGGFSVGSDVVIQEPFTPFDIATPITYAFISGGNTAWTDGEIYPDFASSLRPEFGYVGGSFTGSDSLSERITSKGNGNFDSEFDSARDYYVSLSNNLFLETSNVNVTLQWSGLWFSCLDNSGRYIVHLDSSQFIDVTWFEVDASCPFGSTWVFNIGGDYDMTFTGGDFPGIAEKILFNIGGENRNVIVASGVNGNILAPLNNLIQSGGVMHGLVVVNNIQQWSSGTMPDCADLQPFSFLVPVQNTASLGASTINVVSFSIVNAGDSFLSNGVEYKVVKRIDNNGQAQIVLNQPLQSAANAGEYLKFTVDPNQARTNDVVEKKTDNNNSGVSVVASLFVIIAALLF